MEAEFYRWLAEHVPPHPSLPLGIVDDAAVLQRGASPSLVITTDLVSDGVDFRLEEIDARRAGRKALAVNLSDLAAMAARPVAATISIALPRAGAAGRSSLELAIALYEGLLPLAKEFDLAIAGGDTNTHDGPTVISVTAIGEVTSRGPLTRSGGRIGDQLLVTGALGGSVQGHHLGFTPRVCEALLLHERYELDAGMDISDGLALDASRLAEASGCGVVIDVDRLPISDSVWDLARRAGVAAALLPAAAAQHALGDGEDFELLLAVGPHVAEAMLEQQPLECSLTCIGELVEKRGLWQRTAGGELQPLESQGWQH